MKCPCCCQDNSRVLDTRKFDESNRRVRECQACGHVWSTWEMAETAITVYEPDPKKLPFPTKIST